MKYTESHEWVDMQEDHICTVGVTEFAQRELGDIVFVELPAIGKQVEAGKEAAVLESTKAAADVYAPLTGIIVAANDALKQSPELINTSPEKEGWIFKIKAINPAEFDKLMSESDYKAKKS